MGATAQLRSVRSLRNTPNLSLLSERVRRDHETLVEASACPYCLYMAAHTHPLSRSTTSVQTPSSWERDCVPYPLYNTPSQNVSNTCVVLWKHSLLNTLLYNNCCSRNTCSFPSWREIRADGGFGTLNTRIATKLNGWTLKSPFA